jgi:hypothetical protein
MSEAENEVDEVDEQAARLAAIELYGGDVVVAGDAAFDEACLLRAALEQRTIA